jgi:acyl carrier protein
VLNASSPMDPVELRAELKRLIVSELNLKTRDPATIGDDAPLFGGGGGEGLGLDSLDALQLAMVIEEKLGVRIPDGDEARAIFRSVRSIADHVAKVRGG